MSQGRRLQLTCLAESLALLGSQPQAIIACFSPSLSTSSTIFITHTTSGRVLLNLTLGDGPKLNHNGVPMPVRIRSTFPQQTGPAMLASCSMPAAYYNLQGHEQAQPP